MSKRQAQSKKTSKAKGSGLRDENASTCGTNAGPITSAVKGPGIVLNIFAKPGARYNAITGIDDDGIGVQIAAPPVDGEANTELIKFLSKALGIRKSDISLDKGSKSRNKIIRIAAGINCEEAKQKLQDILDKG